VDARGRQAHIRAVTDFLDFQTLRRPGSPNSFLLAPEGYCEQSATDGDAPVFNMAEGELFDHVLTVLGGMDAIDVEASDREALRVRAVATTPLLKFRDDIDVAILPPAAGLAGARLAIYSRSRVGHYDFGANARRVRSLVKNLRAR